MHHPKNMWLPICICPFGHDPCIILRPSQPLKGHPTMGQIMNKFATRAGGIVVDKDKENKQSDKQKEELDKLIQNYVDEHYHQDFDNITKDLAHFCHAVYRIIEKLSEKGGAMQVKIPNMERLESAFKKAHPDSSKPLNKVEFRKIIEEVITFDSFFLGQRARDIFLYIFGIPLAALMAKRILPGPTAHIADEVFIPAATSGTVFLLAKTNRL